MCVAGRKLDGAGNKPVIYAPYIYTCMHTGWQMATDFNKPFYDAAAFLL